MRSFFDTNVLVYLFDEDHPEKKRTAADLFREEVSKGTAAVSTQVLQEFFYTVTRKLGAPLTGEDAEVVVVELSTLPVVQVDVPMILAAIRRSRALRISFWDGLIVEGALASGADRLLTEDLHAGLEVDGLTIENPFA